MLLISVLWAISFLPAPGQELYPRLVSTEWLEANLKNENLRILDIRFDVQYYWKAHIPGAVYFPADAMRLADKGVPEKLMPPEILALMLGRMGISENTMVVLYTELADSLPPYLVWALDYLGHKNSAVLDGQLDKWRNEGRVLTQDYPAITPTEYRLPTQLNQAVRATADEVRAAVEKGGAVLLDSRPLKAYAGEKGTWKRKGHIPGAKNRFWMDDLNPDGTWKGKEELKPAYSALGVTPDKPVIVYCGKGLQAASTYFTLKHVLGFPDARVYDGSFGEWANLEPLPVETGLK